MSDALRRAAERSVAILLGSFGSRRDTKTAAGDVRKLLQAGLRGEELPETESERRGIARSDDKH